MKRIFAFIIFSILCLNIFAQKQVFENPETYFEDLRNYMKIALSRENIVAEIDTFQSSWENGKIEEGYKFGIILTSNIMANRNAKPLTHFYYYLRTINGFVKNGRIDDYMEWEVGLIELLDVQYELMSKIEKYLEFSAGFTNDNILSQSPSISWKTNSTDFFLINDVENKVMTVQLATFDLNCCSKNDTFQILQTKGIFYPVENKFVGKGGMMTWERIGLTSDSIYALIQDYEIDMSVGAFQAENVSLTNKYYLTEDVLGSFEDKLMSKISLQNPTFPKFYSYDNEIVINEIVPNIDYRGSFNMEGRKFVGKGSVEDYVHLTIKKDKEDFIYLKTKSFNFVETEISSINTVASIRIAEKDSIYHVGLDFEYDINTETCYLNRVGLEINESPFIDTYHEMNIFSGQINWKQGDSLIYIYTTPKTALQYAIFESNEYFSLTKYNALKGYEQTNPLVTLKKFFEATSSYKFYVSEYHKYLVNVLGKMYTEDQAHMQLYNLSKEGFITYDPVEKYAVIQQKLFSFIGNKTGKKDYDAISISSVLEGYYGINGVINLNNMKLDIINPQPIVLSENRRVGVFADTITVQEGKNMKFNGQVRAGLTDFYGRDFYFDYKNFKIELNDVDSLTLIAQSDSLNEKGFYDPVKVESTIEDLSGVLQIDTFNNKSGKESLLQFPRFESKENSYVYYDKIDTAKYNRNKFYFENYPFSIDSLNSISKSAVDSKGKFKSGLFPDFEVTMTLQDDYSLGFNKVDTTVGFDLFKGKYYGIVSLNNSGLSGEGIIEYLTTVAKSNDFKFYPDSVTGPTHSLEIGALKEEEIYTVKDAEGEFPKVTSEDAYFHWKPFENKIETWSTKKGFYMYNDLSVLNGELEISTTGLKGNGKLQFIDGKLESNEYVFNYSTINSDTTNFNLTNDKLKNLPFKTEDVNAFIDTEIKRGTFIANSDTCKIEFPENKYICVMDHFIWDIGNSEINIGAGIPDYDENELIVSTEAERDSLRNILSEEDKKKVRLTGSWFTSVKEGQDSLSFFSESSTYSIKENLIIAQNVPFVEVADATVFPSDFLYIEKNAKLRPIYDCKITATRHNQYHNITHANAFIFGKNEYGGSGTYTYPYEYQTFHLDTIYLDTLYQTIGFAKILEKDSFMLSENFTFNGEVELFANESNLTFKGYTKIINDCEEIVNEPFKFTSKINPDSVLIKLEDPILNKNKRLLSAGVFIKTFNPDVYTTFTSPVKNQASDKPIVSSKGYLYFDPKDYYYKIAEKEKLDSMENQGNYIGLHKNFCFVFAEGDLNLNADLGEVEMKTTGNVLHKLYEKQVVFNMFMGINFFFLDKNIKTIADELIENFYLEPVNTYSNTFNRNLINWVGNQRADELSEEILYFGEFDKVPLEFSKYTFMLSDIKMYWDTLTTSFRSIGEIGIANVFDNQINRYVEGYVEIKKRPSNGDESMDELSIFIHTNENQWYYFFYRGETMSAISTNSEFNDLIYNTKSKELKIQNYEIVPGNKENALRFKKTFTDAEEMEVDTKVIEDIGDENTKIPKNDDTKIIRDTNKIDINIEDFELENDSLNNSDTLNYEIIEEEEIEIEDKAPENKEINNENKENSDIEIKEEEIIEEPETIEENIKTEETIESLENDETEKTESENPE